MASWLLPAVKLILPHVGDIVAAAKPVFTKRRGGEGGEPGTIVSQQIAELQTAVAENATHIKELAEQLRLTVDALEKAAALAEKRVSRIYALAAIAAVLSLAAFGTALYAVLR